MIGGDGIAKDAKGARALDFADMAGLHAEAGEEWRLLDVGARAVPLVNLATGRGDFIPLRVLLGEVGVELAIDFRLERGQHGRANFLRQRPDFFEIDVLGVLVLSEGL